MREVCAGLYQIALGVSNMSLLGEDAALILIDTSPEDGSDAPLATLREEGVPPSEINHALVAHAHQDHAGGLRAVMKATGASVWMHPRDGEEHGACSSPPMWHCTSAPAPRRSLRRPGAGP